VPDARPRLVEKGRYQVLYRGDGSRERVVYDGDSDGDAEVVILYTSSGAVERSELDTDGDGRVDRWEYFDPSGRLVRVDRAELR
jgi:hypothetical protein